jgi:hypothetical protein
VELIPHTQGAGPVRISGARRRLECSGGRRAERLDSFTYSLAAHVLINIDLDRREAELSGATTPKQQNTISNHLFGIGE